MTYSKEIMSSTAPSAASVAVLGHISNGNVDWKTKDDRSLKELESNQTT
ncbi:DUF4357 domain-containing protein [[Clostridium] polysaccharolyticum]|nr:DUF4357 domain-containing protein [[Clostridium] polysaccharolyticum]